MIPVVAGLFLSEHLNQVFITHGPLTTPAPAISLNLCLRSRYQTRTFDSSIYFSVILCFFLGPPSIQTSRPFFAYQTLPLSHVFLFPATHPLFSPKELLSSNPSFSRYPRILRPMPVYESTPFPNVTTPPNFPLSRYTAPVSR